MASNGAKRIGIYNLDKNNCDILAKLTACLTAECRVKYYEKLERYDNLSIAAAVSKLKHGKSNGYIMYVCAAVVIVFLYVCSQLELCVYIALLLYTLIWNQSTLPSYKISNEDLDVLTSEDLTALLYDDDEGITPRSSYEVVMILGHSNIYHVGPFDTSDVVEAILTRHKPSIIALLGCCGGGTRYGPLMRISQIGSKTIFGFYQRRIYPDELVNTSLVLGIRNYFHLKNSFCRPGSKPCPSRVIIRRSFACAALDIPSHQDDPSIFANDSNEPGIYAIQDFFKIFNKKFTANHNPIPLACSQLALFHVFTVEKRIFGSPPTIDTFIENIEQLDASKIEEECRRELEKRQLDQIISLTAEILLLPVLEDTLDKLKDGKWEDVDPLQFMIATLHGYWGKNSYTTMRCCAQFHHDKLKETAVVMGEEDVHRYHLGSIALCLFYESTCVNFDLPVVGWDKKLAFCIELSNSNFASQLEQLASPGIRFEHVTSISISSQEFQEIPQQRELIWEDEHYANMSKLKDDRFIKLFNEDNPTPISISNYCKERNFKPFTYTYAHFENALNALQTSFLPLFQEPEGDINKTGAPYHIKKFDNESSGSKGRMKCFKPWPRDDIKYKYAEMRITDNDPKPSQISRCRFVYQYHHNITKRCCVGVLYFTDSHYGWDLICEEEIDKTLKHKHNFTDNDLRGLNYFEKQKRLNKRELYQLQDKIKEKFPFTPIGILRI